MLIVLLKAVFLATAFALMSRRVRAQLERYYKSVSESLYSSTGLSLFEREVLQRNMSPRGSEESKRRMLRRTSTEPTGKGKTPRVKEVEMTNPLRDVAEEA